MSLRSVAAHLALVLAPLALVLGLAEVAVRATRGDETCPNRFSGLPVWACDPILQFKLNPELDVLGQKPRVMASARTSSPRSRRASSASSRSAIPARSASSSAATVTVM